MVNFKLKFITHFIFILSFIVINSEKTKRILKYEYENGMPFTINELDNGEFEIEFIEYYEDSHGLPAFGWAFVSKENEIKNLTNLFDEIFKDSDEQIISVTNNELTKEQNEIIIRILDDHGLAYHLKYEVINKL